MPLKGRRSDDAACSAENEPIKIKNQESQSLHQITRQSVQNVLTTDRYVKNRRLEHQESCVPLEAPES